MSLLFIKPAEGLRVLKPDTLEPLDAEGEGVLDGLYWRRRLADEDVVEFKPPKAARPAPEDPSPAAPPSAPHPPRA